MILELLRYWAVAIVVALELISVYCVRKGYVDDAVYFFIWVGQVVAMLFLVFYPAMDWYNGLTDPDIPADQFSFIVFIFSLVTILVLTFFFKRCLYNLIEKYF